MTEFEKLTHLRHCSPLWAKDGLTTWTRIQFSWRDRLRILFGGPVEVEVFTATEGELGRTETASCCRVHSPGFLFFAGCQVGTVGTAKRPAQVYIKGIDLAKPDEDQTIVVEFRGDKCNGRTALAREYEEAGHSRRCSFQNSNRGRCVRPAGHYGDCSVTEAQTP
jgi:hypothetical protein